MADARDLTTRLLELTDRHDWPGREAMMTPDCEFVTPAGALQGPAASTAFSVPLMAAFPNARHVVSLLAEAGDRVVVEGVWVGSHEGPLATPAGEVPATGRSLNLPFAAVFQVRGDLFSSLHIYFDQMTFLAQLGLLPETQPA